HRGNAAVCHGVYREAVFGASLSRHCEERKRRSNPCIRMDCFAALAITTVVARIISVTYRFWVNPEFHPHEQEARALSRCPAKTLCRTVPLRRIGRISSQITRDQRQGRSGQGPGRKNSRRQPQAAE